uniref:ANK_REP_REGION domain-containing protein n=1 Tax=Caenorhabditis tropicalis TaxID=1561998 RepID=A0A1I7UYT9_9PELO
MNNPEESAVTDLCHFVNLVLNGMIDVHHSAFELIQYSFQVRSLKDVVRRGSENPELIPQIEDQIHHLVIYLNEEIIALCGKASPIGLDDSHFVVLHKRLQLMYEMWKAMKTNKKYEAAELMSHVDASREAMKIIYGDCKNYHRWKELSTDLQEFFLDEKKEELSVIEEVEPAWFAREDGVVSSIAHEKAQSEDEGKKKQFVAKTEKVLSNYRAKNPDYKTMRELVENQGNFRLEGIYCDNLIEEFISVWDTAIDLETEHSDKKYSFGALLRKVFMMMTDKRKNDFAIKLFDKYKQDSNDVLPCLENFVENFQAGLTKAINDLPLDSNVLSNKMELFEEKKDPIMWYLFISPAYTVQQLLTICVDNKGYIPIIGRIFRSIPTLFERSISVTSLRSEKMKKEKLLITLLHKVFRIGRTTWTTGSQWENAAMITMSCAKERKRKEGQLARPEDKALLDPFSLLNFALTELLEENRKPQKSVEVFVKILQRLLANNNNMRIYTNYRFANSFTDDGENVLPTPIIIQLMFDLLIEYDGQSIEICDSAREILKSIGGRLKNDEVIFDGDTCVYLTEGNFNSAPWWIKYSIYTWFSMSLGNPKKQIPSGVFKTIPEQFLDEFEQIKSEEMSTVPDCYLRSLFELGLFDKLS